MSALTANVSPLHQRVIDNMHMRKFDGKPQIRYICSPFAGSLPS